MTEPDLAALLRSQDDDTAIVAMTALEQKYANREDPESPDSWGYLAYPAAWFGQMLAAAVKACSRRCVHCSQQILACRCPDVPGCQGWYHPGNSHQCDSRRVPDGLILQAAPARPRFLDLGAGIGTKCLAAERAGCEARGVEHDERLVAEARKLNALVGIGDVRDIDVSREDIVWCNSPFRDPGQEIAFEADVAARMKPGAVLMLGNKAGPDPAGWERLTTVIERDGAWRKPL